jgi:hypothetical protein
MKFLRKHKKIWLFISMIVAASMIVLPIVSTLFQVR